MAWLQTDPSGNCHISFRFGGAKFKRSLRTNSEREAFARLHRLAEYIRHTQQRDIPKACISHAVNGSNLLVGICHRAGYW